jgi:hypothetical protein
MRLLAFGFSLGPALFGIGFLAPLIAVLLDTAGLSPPLGLSSIQFGLGLGVLLGIIARQRKTWLW